MHSHQRIRPAATPLLAGALIVAGCSTTPVSTTLPGGPTSAAPTTAAVTTPEPVTDAPVLVLEDAGLETPMQAGTYTSRLFEPTITIELDGSWFRRDAGDARKFNIRRGSDGGEDLTFFSGIDFIECGNSGVVEQPPDASTVVDMIFGMRKLNTTQPAEVELGNVVGTEIRLLGGGDGSFDDPIEDWPKNGCVISQGEVPFPGDSGWLVMLDSSVEQYFFVETDGGPVMIRARADDSTTDVEALWDYMREVIGTVEIT